MTTKAIILAAGKPNFTDCAVSAIQVGGANLLDVQVSTLQRCGINDITVVGGFAFHELRRSDVRLVENKQWETTGSAASLALITDLLDSKSDLIVIYGDTIFEPDVIEQVLASGHSISALCFLTPSEHERLRFREFAVVQDGYIQEISEAPSRTGLRTVFAGMALIRQHKIAALRGYLAEHGPTHDSHLGNLLDGMISGGVEIAPILIEDGWTELSDETNLGWLYEHPKMLSRILPIHTDWIRRAEKYNRLDWVNNDKLLSTIVDIARACQPKTVLDVGTGTGKVLLGVKQAVRDAEFWGVDSSEAMLSKAPGVEDVRLVCDDAEQLTRVPENYFDFVTARMVFHHLNSPHRAAKSIRRVMKYGGLFVLCEGVPPSQRTVEWYTEMFRFKEDRNTLCEGDLIQIMASAGFDSIVTRTVIMKNASLNNWLDNSGIPEENIRIIKEMHYNSPKFVRDDYDMTYTDADCLMTWRFAVTAAVKV